MAKAIKTTLKLQITGGQANPAPPIGTALGPHGINLAEFCKQFNAATTDKNGEVIPAVITIYEDRSFSFVLKTPPVSALLKKELGIEKGSSEPNKKKVGSVSKSQAKVIAEKKMVDLNANDVEAAMKIIAGTARSMGVEVEE